MQESLAAFLFKKHKKMHEKILNPFQPQHFEDKNESYIALNAEEAQALCHDLFENLEDEVQAYQNQVKNFCSFKNNNKNKRHDFNSYLCFIEVKLSHLKASLCSLIKLVESNLSQDKLYLMDFFKNSLKEHLSCHDYYKLSKVYKKAIQDHPMIHEIHKSMLDYFNFRDHFAMHLCCDTDLLLEKIRSEKKLLLIPSDQSGHLEELQHVIKFFHHIKDNINRSTKLLENVMHNSYMIQIKTLMMQTKLCLKNYPYVDIKMLIRIQTDLTKSLLRLKNIRQKEKGKSSVHMTEYLLIQQNQNKQEMQKKRLSYEEINKLYALFKMQLESVKLVAIALKKKSII